MKGSIMKNKLKILMILSTLLFLMTACSGESMIKLSEENQKIVEQKQAKLNQKKKNSQKTDKKVDHTKWKISKKNNNYKINDFISFPMNELKIFSDGQSQKRTYTCFLDEKNSYAQTISIDNNNVMGKLIHWDKEAIYQQNISKDKVFIDQKNNDNKPLDTILTSNLNKEASWKFGKETAKITEIYDEIILKNKKFRDVIEVSVGKNIYYFAKNQGLVAELSENKFWYLEDVVKDVMLVTQIDLFVPNPQQNTLINKQSQEFHWQTNDTMINALTFVFRNNNWINSEQSVKDIKIEGDLATVTFSPTVVAQFNQHPQGEQAVIASIIANICKFTGVEKVCLKTNESNLVPWTYYVQNNGIYNYDEEWQTTIYPQMLEQ